ncbi:MAG: hypothetical protein DRP29_07255 [Thermodesulfobacteriota bacterium]|nr:MAG: hypothetical protein DRP29_07255 [Thermodesulfobacteriota bacterium]
MKTGISVNLYDLKNKKEAIFRLMHAIIETMNRCDFYLWEDFDSVKIKEDEENKIITFELKGKRPDEDKIIVMINAIYEN